MKFDQDIIKRMYGVIEPETYKIEGNIVIINSPPNGDFYYKIDADTYDSLINHNLLPKYYEIDSFLHRTDGPAIEWREDDDEFVQWYINGKELSFEKWCEKLKKTNEEIVQLKLMYGNKIDMEDDNEIT